MMEEAIKILETKMENLEDMADKIYKKNDFTYYISIVDQITLLDELITEMKRKIS